MKQLRLLIIAVIALVGLYSCSGNDTVGPTDDDGGSTDSSDTALTYVQSPLTKRIIKKTILIDSVYADTLFKVYDGVKETDIYYENGDHKPMHVFILRVDMNNSAITMEAAMTYDKSADRFNLNTVPAMAANIDSSGHRVVAGVNADFFNVDAPWGIVEKDGKVLKDSWDDPQSQTFFAVLKNGDPYIGSRQQFNSMQDMIKDALGASDRLVRGDRLLRSQFEESSPQPRTGIGIGDNNIVYIIVADGRSSHYSSGLTRFQLGIMLRACGADNAINLDGGGSSTFIIRKNFDKSSWEVRNRPSGGQPRAVSDAWMVIAKK